MVGRKFIDQLRPAAEDEATGGGHAIFPFSPGGIAPIAVFKILHERFGKPNHWGDPAKTLWAWALAGKNGVLDVYDWKGGWSIGFVGKTALTPELKEDAKRLLEDLVALARRVRPSTAAAVGGLITNPYRIFSDIADSLQEQIADLKRHSEETLAAYREGRQRGTDAADREAFAEELAGILGVGRETYVRTRAFLAAAMLAHIVSLEGFLNLVYHLFMKSGLADQQVRRRIEREPLDLKLRLVDTFCDCFEMPPIDHNSELYKAFLYLVSIRTDFAHAKLTAAMEAAVVIEEDYPFLVPSEPPTKYGIVSDPLALDEAMVQQAGRVVRSIVRQLIRSMKPDIRYPFAIVHHYEQLQYSRNEDGRVSIVLDPEEDDVPHDWIDEMLAGEGDEWNLPKPDAHQDQKE